MNLLKSFVIALSMFSRMPVPRLEWDAKSMRYTMAMFPLVGVFVGALVLLWGWVCGRMGIGAFLCGTGFALLPVLITGGIHVDGFCDTTDALASRADREKRLEILKDSHVGAFAVIGVACYLLLYAALAGEVAWGWPALLGFACSFVLSRALSGIAVVFFPTARNSGLAHTFADAAARKASGAILFVLLLAAAGGMVAFAGAAGVFMLAGAGVMFLIYYLISKRSFGGITGDLAGWFLQLCEVMMLGGLLLAQLLLQKGLLPW